MKSAMALTVAQEVVGEGAVDIAEACRFTGLGRTYLYGLMERRELTYSKVGKRRLIPRSELVRILAAGLVGGAVAG